ncbi:hypothetical protein [Nonomuraea gerenzanensis]|uniref:hypothetical protein n=1 Tax=Nonomuraea gerenzanensis TaxID=93944 RepID=UPI001CD9B9AC|nr:hypothetical protein [Nonomuraea gerenzanensis]UBU08459.1 hypothetical protein LCN96_29130 [Nonomuraea gerenzanensis]
MQRRIVSPGALVYQPVWRPAPSIPLPAEKIVLVGGGEKLRALLAEELGGRLHLAGDPDLLPSVPSAVALFAPQEAVQEGADETARAEATILGRLRVLRRMDTGRLWCLTTGVREAASRSSLGRAPMWGSPASWRRSIPAAGAAWSTCPGWARYALSAHHALVEVPDGLPPEAASIVPDAVTVPEEPS